MDLLQYKEDRRKLRHLLETGEYGELGHQLMEMPVSAIVGAMEHLSPNEQMRVFNLLPLPLSARTFEYLPLEVQRYLLKSIDTTWMARVLNEMSPDDRTALLKYLPNQVVKELIGLLSEEERKVTLALLGYPENSVGRLMTPDYIAIKEHWTVDEVLEYVRTHGSDSETLAVVYVVDEEGKLIDDIRIREFLLSSRERLVSEIMDKRFVALNVTQHQEEAVEMFRKHGRMALPVIDQWGTLFGIVTIDDILTVAKEEDTEDIQKLGGTEALDEPYLAVSLMKMVRKRAVWLVVLFMGEMLTASAMANFEDELGKAIVLALFIPLIISSGGNSGSQATTLIIRAMSLGEVRLRDWWRVMSREIVAGAMLGTILGVIGFLRIVVWQMYSPMFGKYWLLIALTLGTTLVGVVLWGSLMGSMLPFLLRKLKIDPATASAPLVATLVDVTGLILYFSVAYFFLRGTLL